MGYEFNVVEIEPQFAAVVSEKVAMDGIGALFPRVFEEVMAVVDPAGICGPPFARYDMDGDGFAVDAGFPVREPITPSGSVHSIQLPGGSVVQTMHVGPYEQVVAAYQAVEGWFGANGYRPSGAPWETYLDEAGVENPRTIVTWPCAKA